MVRHSMFERMQVLEVLVHDLKISDALDKAINLILKSDIVLVGGNGGSAADSSHFVAELLGRFNNKMVPFPAVNMMSDIAYLTSISNDVSYDDVFLQYIDAFRGFNSSYLFISTSGTSRNVVKAIDKLVNEMNNDKVILITGNFDIKNDNFDKILTIKLPSVKTEYIQEMYMMILHDLAYGVKTRILI